MSSLAFSSQRALPEADAPLEEACPAGPRDMAAALAFALGRRPAREGRPVLIAATRAWLSEHGRPYGPGMARAFVLAPCKTEAETLWVLEQALRSGAVALAVGAVETPELPQSRRLEFAARQGEAAGVLVPRSLDGLSAARRRWRISSEPSGIDPLDIRAPGPARLRAELVRGRGERPGQWLLEQDDETHRLRLADRLADFGQAPIAGTGAPSGLAA